MSGTRVVSHVACLGCGCVCDDIDVVVSEGRIVEARRACSLGVAWFGDGGVPWEVRVGGRAAPIDDALDAIAAMLRQATRPLVYLAPDITCDAQREAVALADVAGAALDSVTSATARASLMAAQERGRATATLGELRNRADVVVWWGVDPDERYPRYAERYCPYPSGVHIAHGRGSRMVVAVDVGPARGPVDVDRRYTVPAERELEFLAALLRGARRSEPEGEGDAAALARVMARARYCLVAADGEQGPGQDAVVRRRMDALIAVTHAFNAVSRCALGVLRAGGNRSGAESVMTWQTGYPFAVDFARGFPRYGPHDGTAGARLARGDVDAALVIGSAALVPSQVLERLAHVPAAVVGPRATGSVLGGGVAAIDTGVAGIHVAGTAVRMDDVPIRLRAPLAAPVATEVIARGVSERIVAGHGLRGGMRERPR
jgi:formylmethanofuran dehydrogenase subunit B